MPARYQYTMRDTAHPVTARESVSAASSAGSYLFGEINLVSPTGEEADYMVHRVFPQRRSRYVSDSVHRTQNNLLRALGTSESQAVGPSTAELSLQKSPSLETQPIKGKMFGNFYYLELVIQKNMARKYRLARLRVNKFEYCLLVLRPLIMTQYGCGWLSLDRMPNLIIKYIYQID